MRRQVRRLLGPALASAVVLGVACDGEDPTGVGGPLFPDGVARTIEVVLEADRFLLSDTTLPGFMRPGDAGFLMVAHQFGGALEANALIRFRERPRTITVRTTAGNTVTDTLPIFFGGSVIIKLDTARSTWSEPVEFQLYRIEEPWDPETATWTHRVDSTDARLPWTQPGGTRSALVGSALFGGGTDSVVIPVDSQTIEIWADTANQARGALLRIATPGAQFIVDKFESYLVAQARSSIREDTVVATPLGSVGGIFVFDPPVPAPADLQVGGVPNWRSYLWLQPRLDTVSVPCPAGPPGCFMPLSEASINLAALVLQPLPVPAGFLPEDSLAVEAWAAFPSEYVPLARVPLSADAIGVAPNLVDASRFAGDGAEPVELPITGFVAMLAARRTASGGDPPTSLLALLAGPEAGTFGYGRFGSIRAGAAAPRLRLILTEAREVKVR